MGRAPQQPAPFSVDFRRILDTHRPISLMSALGNPTGLDMGIYKCTITQRVFIVREHYAIEVSSAGVRIILLSDLTAGSYYSTAEIIRVAGSVSISFSPNSSGEIVTNSVSRPPTPGFYTCMSSPTVACALITLNGFVLSMAPRMNIRHYNRIHQTYLAATAGGVFIFSGENMAAQSLNGEFIGSPQAYRAEFN